MRYVARIDEYECSAHGDCAVVAPEAFEVDEMASVVGEAEPEKMLAAARACPAAAISLFDADTGEQVYP